MKLFQFIGGQLGILNPAKAVMSLGEWIPSEEREGEKDMKKGLNIELSLDTDILILKLEAIAKHATALANELDEVDSAKCEECGGPLDIHTVTLHGDEAQVDIEETRVCPRCNQHE